MNNRGGYRFNAGRKSSWASGCSFEETKTIRIPAYIADEVLKAAHLLDAGYTLNDIVNPESQQLNLLDSFSDLIN